mmetsp:Transcript_13551/g.41841  ORF Transcript_13551/g.41841 Transcript_13551/m.41841 type:complete len:305 (+) Transcript_13551:96-1010(+)
MRRRRLIYTIPRRRCSIPRRRRRLIQPVGNLLDRGLRRAVVRGKLGQILDLALERGDSHGRRRTTAFRPRRHELAAAFVRPRPPRLVPRRAFRRPPSRLARLDFRHDVDPDALRGVPLCLRGASRPRRRRDSSAPRGRGDAATRCLPPRESFFGASRPQRRRDSVHLSTTFPRGRVAVWPLIFFGGRPFGCWTGFFSALVVVDLGLAMSRRRRPRAGTPTACAGAPSASTHPQIDSTEKTRTSPARFRRQLGLWRGLAVYHSEMRTIAGAHRRNSARESLRAARSGLRRVESACLRPVCVPPKN